MKVARFKGLASIILLFLILGVVYGAVTPPFEASDEIWHYPVVKYIADGKGLPVQNPSEETAWRQEGSQPPLYYLLMAGLTFWINTDDLPERLWYNPHAQTGVPLAHGNKNMVVHTTADRFPYRGAVLAVHLIRWLSLLLQAVTVVFTYLIADEVSKHDQAMSLLATALVAFNPMFLFIAASVNNDNLIVPLSTVTLWLLLLILRQGITLRRVVVLGVLCGLAALTKLSGLGLVGLSIAVLFVVAMRDRKTQWFWRGVVAIGIGVAAIAGWWYLRNWRLYGDPLGTGMMLQIAGGRAEPANWKTLLGEFQGFRISYWGLFGGVNVLAQQWIYWLFDAMTIGALIGWIALLLQYARHRPAVQHTGVLALWVAITAVSLIRWTMLTLASQGRLLFPASAAIAGLMAIGLLWWARGRMRYLLAAILGTLVFVAAATSPVLAIAPAYAQAPVLDEHDLPPDMRPIYADFEGKMMLLGYHLGSRAIHQGDQLSVTAYWKALAPMSEDYSVFVQLFDHDHQKVGALDTYPGLGTRPTSLLQPGQIIADHYAVEVTKPISQPSACDVEIGLYELQTMKGLSAKDPQGQEVGRVVLSGAKLVPLRWPRYQPAVETQFRFADKVTLIGVDVEPDRALPGQDIHLTLYWQADTPLAEDWTVFVHVLDPNGTVITQADSPPASGAYPTSLWNTGEVIADRHILHLPVDISATECLIRVGFYRPTDNWRPPVTDAGGNPLPDGIVMLPVKIVITRQ